VMDLRGINYRWKTDASSDPLELGFIAQEVEQVVPELVYTDPDNGIKSMSYGNLTPLLVNAVQEQQEMIDENSKSLFELSDSYNNLKLVDNLLASKVDLLETNLNQVNQKLGNDTDVIQQQAILALQQKVDEVFLMLDKKNEVASKEADLTSLTERVSFIEQLLLGTKPVSASSVDENLEESTGNVENKVLEDLTVTGKANIFDLGVVGDIIAGQIVIRGHEAQINSLALPLELQSEATAPVEIMAGKVSIDTKGNLNVKETITAKKYEVDATEEESASIGEYTMKSGETEALIESTSVTESSKIFLTPTIETDSQLAVVEKVRGKSFKVKVTQKLEKDISFNWWIVN